MKIYPPGEVAYFLRRALGPLREWSDCLADMRRNKTNVDGMQLLPVCQIHDGRRWRPGYTVESLAEFIRQVRTSHPEIRTDAPAIGIEIGLDPSDERSWRIRKLGSPTKH